MGIISTFLIQIMNVSEGHILSFFKRKELQILLNILLYPVGVKEVLHFFLQHGVFHQNNTKVLAEFKAE